MTYETEQDFREEATLSDCLALLKSHGVEATLKGKAIQATEHYTDVQGNPGSEVVTLTTPDEVCDFLGY